MPQVEGAPKSVNSILESAYAEALKKYPGNKAKASKIAWAAVKTAGWMKGKDGKWMKKKLDNASEGKPVVIDAFKPGDYPQLAAFGGEAAAAQIVKDVAATYDPKLHEAPVILGHVSDYPVKSAIPSFGWVGKVIETGGHLKLQLSQFHDEAKKLIQEGLFKKVSASFYTPSDPANPTPGKWHLHHLALLGGQPPAVKGLAGIAFMEFSDVSIETVDVELAEMTMEGMTDAANKDTYAEIELECAQMLSKIQEYLSSEEDDEAKMQKCSLAVYDCYNACCAELGLHSAFIEKGESIMEKAKSALNDLKEKFSKKLDIPQSTRKESIDMDEKILKELRDEIAGLKSQVTTLATEKQALQTQFAEGEKKRTDDTVEQRVTEFREQLTKEGYPTAKMDAEGVFALARQLLRSAEIELAEGKKKSPMEILGSLVHQFKPVVTEEIAPDKGTDNESLLSLAEELHVDPKLKVNGRSLSIVSFSDSYARKFANDLPGKTHPQKRAHVTEQILLGKMKLDPALLK